MFVKNEFISDENFENDVFKRFCENVQFVEHYEVNLPFISGTEMIGDNCL